MLDNLDMLEMELDRYPFKEETTAKKSLELIQISRNIISTTKFLNRNKKGLMLLYDAFITSAYGFQGISNPLKRNKEASKAFYEAGIAATTLYFEHYELHYARKAVEAFDNYLANPLSCKKKLITAQNTLCKVLNSYQ